MEIADVRERFVGRTREIDRFVEWLRDTDPETPLILYLYDILVDENKKGGVGKTWLLRRFADTAKELIPDIVTVYVDFFNITDRDGVEVARRIMAALKEAYPEWDITNFEKSEADYTNALQERREDSASDHRNRLADAVIADLHALNGQLSDANKRLLVFFDTYEVIQDNPLTAALRLEQAFPDDYDFSQIGFVIAGRFELDWSHPNWRGRKDKVLAMPIEPFSPSEIVEYFEKLSSLRLTIDPDDIRVLYERTEGRPILIGLVNDLLDQRIMTLTDLISDSKANFDASLVVKVNDLENPIAPIILFMAHAYHRFNFTLLNWILREAELSDLLQDIDPEKISQQLLNLSFVRRPSSGEDFVLHDEMRPLVNRYCWDALDPDRRSRKHLSNCVIVYYENELQHVQSEQLKQAYTAELLFHKLYVDLESGYKYFSEHSAQSINLRLLPFARALLREAKAFEKQMSPVQRYNLKYGEARLLSKEESPAVALPLFQELEQEADTLWLEGHKADLLFEKGVAYQELSRYSEAIECFTVGMELDKQRGHMSDYAYSLNRLGTVYQKQGQLDVALSYYEDGLKIHIDLHSERAAANDLVSISNIYRLQGKVDEALRRAKTSLRIRSKLFEQGKISEVYLGTSLTAIGSIYYQINDAQKAEDFFQQALDIYVRTGHKKGLATIYNRLGKLSMDQGAWYHARQWFEKAYTTALGIDTELQISSLNKQGWLLVLEERYQRAIKILQEAINLAKEVHDDYQQAESLIDLAEALQRSDNDKEAQQVRQEARNICLKYGYYYLLGLSYESEGDVLYNNDNYQQAFSNYGEACYYMARYNDLEYRKRLRKVVDALFEVPSEEIGPIIDKLVAYWSLQGADKEFPDFVSSCLEVKSLLGL